jgi:hypothetical protein
LYTTGETFKEMEDTTPEQAKTKRTAAKRQFTRAEGRLVSAVNSQADEWTLSKRYEDLQERWNVAQNTHDGYVATLSEDGVADAEEPWITDLSNRFDKLEMDVGK